MEDSENPTTRLHSSSTASQISSVGFNTLKKLNTNSSSNTVASTASTKPNALTRLFTRNKSNTTLDEPTYSDVESESLHLEKKPSNVFRLTNKMNKRRSKNNKDLTVQTEGLNAPTPPTLARKGSVSSPVSTLHNFFHRTSAASGLNSATIDSIDEQFPRTTIGLSSNNSNSTITDANFARVYKFTDSNNLVDDDNEDHEGFKKLFMPADQFLKARLPNSPSSLSMDEENEGARFWNTLMVLMKPVIMPSQQKKLNNGHRAPQLIMTIEDISSFVQDNYVAKLDEEEDSIDIKAREIIQDLNGFFNRVIITFHKEFKSPSAIPEGLDPLCKSWVKLSEEWIYFRDHIMYFVLNSFMSLSSHRLFVRTQIDIEQLLLNSFRDAIVQPFIDFRNTTTRKDKNFLLNYQDGKLLGSILQCLGLINSTQVYEANDEKSLDFLNFFVWITEL